MAASRPGWDRGATPYPAAARCRPIKLITDIAPVSPEPGPVGLRLKSDAHRQSLTQSRATATLVLTDSEVYCMESAMDGLKM
jgi:hypothetical protein